MSGTLLDTILESGAIEVVFQPIVALDHGKPRLHGLECLTRGPRGTNIERADVLFEYVRRKHEEPAIDRLCVSAAIAAAARLDDEPRISINVHASTLERDSEFPAFLGGCAERSGIAPQRITVEITEHSPVWDSPAFLDALRTLRRMDLSLALDDIGLGQSNYKMILDILPDYFKVDRYIVSGCSVDYYRRAILESIHQLATRFGGTVVAEGVETIEELAAVSQIGISLIQGYLFSEPVRPPRVRLFVEELAGRQPCNSFEVISESPHRVLESLDEMRDAGQSSGLPGVENTPDRLGRVTST